MVRSGSSAPENKDNKAPENYNTAGDNKNKASKQPEKPGE